MWDPALAVRSYGISAHGVYEWRVAALRVYEFEDTYHTPQSKQTTCGKVLITLARSILVPQLKTRHGGPWFRFWEIGGFRK